MLEWIAALALAGGTTMATAMAEDTWQSVRDTFGRLLGRGNADRESRALNRLDASAATVAQATGDDEEAVLSQVAGQWQTRLQDFLEEYPDAREELEALISKVRSQIPEERAVQISQMISNSTIHGDSIQIGSAGRDITIGRKP
ncbi:hypothetical protein AB0H69_06190 [Streptomyces phaeochromogenes]|uniref:hypothetical protein n=1 Tax=Streptomyces phaeochromogenes TaxID=1923 RepID=UPI0033C96B65